MGGEEIGRSCLLDIFLQVPTFEEASLFCPRRPAHPGAVSSLSVSLRRGEPAWKNTNTPLSRASSQFQQFFYRSFRGYGRGSGRIAARGGGCKYSAKEGKKRCRFVTFS